MDEGQPKKPIYKRWWLWAIVAVVLIGAFSGGNDPSVQPAGTNAPVSSSSNQADSTPTPVPTPAPAPIKSDDSIKAGMYKVGTDLPAGEYVLIGKSYFQVSKDSTGQMDSIICNDNFENRSIITVKDGQYFTLKAGKIYPASKAPEVEPSNGKLPSGMYKVGTDLQPGEYKIASIGDGYVEIAKDSSHLMDAVVSNDNFSGEKYVTVKAGQYIKLVRAELLLK
jgi:hypothetical protein